MGISLLELLEDDRNAQARQLWSGGNHPDRFVSVELTPLYGGTWQLPDVGRRIEKLLFPA